MVTVLEKFLLEKDISYQFIATKIHYTRPYITQVVKGQRKLNSELISKLKTVDDDLSTLLEVLGDRVQHELSPQLLLMVLLHCGKINFDSLVGLFPNEQLDEAINGLEETREYCTGKKDVESRIQADLLDVKIKKLEEYKHISKLKVKQVEQENRLATNSELLKKKSTIAAEIIDLYFDGEEDYMIVIGPVKRFKENLIEEKGIDLEEILIEHLQNEGFDADEVDLVDGEVIEIIVDEIQKQIKTTEYHKLDEDDILHFRSEYLNQDKLF
ncbi:hypothetical protein [Lysinibacillus sp. BW-2-10]|uniref:hypothetical protein n=1 Tax=Lysinibacillus sp. BW-2-10 TaxID=2590030 RepID=UPI00117D27CD|nr:hypothetical protein [Lysinibacillus sp. BW-2-10]TSI05277.1 hypothetical protein FJQ64_13300 [Lysinibacillus sp. BW-2-10]